MPAGEGRLGGIYIHTPGEGRRAACLGPWTNQTRKRTLPKKK
jgi:hypothetical protein